MADVTNPVRRKVIAGAVGAGAGATVSAFLVWLLGVLVWGGVSDAGHELETVGLVPKVVSALVVLAVTVGGSFLAGYWITDPDTVVAAAPHGLVDDNAPVYADDEPTAETDPDVDVEPFYLTDDEDAQA